MSLFRVTVQYLITTWEDERSQTETPPQCLGSRARFLDWKDTLADQCLLLHARAIRMQQARPPQSHPRVGGGGGGPRSDQILANATVRLVVSVAAKRARFVSTRSKTRLLCFFRLIVSRLVADVVTVQYSTNSPKGSQSSLQWCANRLPAQVSPGSSKQQHLGTFTYGQQCSSYFLPCSILCYGSGRRMEQNPDSFKEWHYAYETLDVKIDVWIQEQEERKR